MRSASAVDSITDGFYYFVASGVDTVRATQMHMNTEFRSSPCLFVWNDQAATSCSLSWNQHGSD